MRYIEEAESLPDIEVHISIHLGGMIVFAADDNGLKWLSERLPKDDRFPMRLMHHAAFHSPLLDHIPEMARAANPLADFGAGELSAVDGQGKVWSPKAFDPAAIYDYTLGAQLNRTYDFTRAVQVAAAEFAPDKIIVLGPGTTLGRTDRAGPDRVRLARAFRKGGFPGPSGGKSGDIVDGNSRSEGAGGPLRAVHTNKR